MESNSATPTVNKINALPESPNEVAERMMMIERLGGVLKYADVADRVFRSNLLMIDLHFPRVLTEMVRIMHLDGISRISELTEVIKQMNPLKIKDELINKHKFYEFKMKQFLMALALRMRPQKIYNGLDSAVEGILLVDGNGEVLCYHKSEKQIMEDFLFLNTPFRKGSLGERQIWVPGEREWSLLFQTECKDWVVGITVDAVKLIMMAYLYKIIVIHENK